MCIIALLPELMAGWVAVLSIRRIAQSGGQLKGKWLAMGALVISIFAGPVALIGVFFLIGYLIVSISL